MTTKAAAPKKAKPPPAKTGGCIGCAAVVLVGIAILLVFGQTSSRTARRPRPSAPATKSQKTPAPASARPTATPTVTDAQCQADLSCWGKRFEVRAIGPCQRAVESMAKFDFEWTDGWTEPKFPRFTWGDKEAGTIKYVGDKVKFQNGFGAWQHMVYGCIYDPSTGSVVDVQIVER